MWLCVIVLEWCYNQKHTHTHTLNERILSFSFRWVRGEVGCERSWINIYCRLGFRSVNGTHVAMHHSCFMIASKTKTNGLWWALGDLDGRPCTHIYTCICLFHVVMCVFFLLSSFVHTPNWRIERLRMGIHSFNVVYRLVTSLMHIIRRWCLFVLEYTNVR